MIIANRCFDSGRDLWRITDLRRSFYCLGTAPTETHMYETHLAFIPPEDMNIKIWRYMDFTKFVSLLDKGALYFARSDKFEDPYEGVYPKTDAIKYFGDLKASSRMREISKQMVYVNCWHINEYESAAMWRLYLKSNEGVAIQSTFKRLIDSFKGINAPIFIGKVTYIDYSKESIPQRNLNIFYPFLYKRKSFEHERELRAVLGDLNPQKEPVYVGVDISTLIEKVYVAPTSEDWFYDLINSIVSNLNSFPP